jgi:hypothetical protein
VDYIFLLFAIYLDKFYFARVRPLANQGYLACCETSTGKNSNVRVGIRYGVVRTFLRGSMHRRKFSLLTLTN